MRASRSLARAPSLKASKSRHAIGRQPRVIRDQSHAHAPQRSEFLPYEDIDTGESHGVQVFRCLGARVFGSDVF